MQNNLCESDIFRPSFTCTLRLMNRPTCLNLNLKFEGVFKGKNTIFCILYFFQHLIWNYDSMTFMLWMIFQREKGRKERRNEKNWQNIEVIQLIFSISLLWSHIILCTIIYVMCDCLSASNANAGTLTVLCWCCGFLEKRGERKEAIYKILRSSILFIDHQSVFNLFKKI